MNSAEGYIKFNCNFIRKETFYEDYSEDIINELIQFRQKLYYLGLIGVNEVDIGFGNISHRIVDNKFIISGTATGSIAHFNREHLCLVKSWDIDRNMIYCEGLLKPSSESLTHAVIYQTLDDINAIIHLHSKELWDKHLNILPTTPMSAEYGTIKLAKEINKLVTNYSSENIIILGGHEDGIISYGKDIHSTFENIIGLFSK